MMLKLNGTHRRLVWWPIEAQLARDGGGSQKARFKVQLELLTPDEIKATRESATSGEDADLEMLLGKIRDWAEVTNQDGQEVAFDPGLLRSLLNGDDGIPLRQALFGGLIVASLGGAEKKP